MGRPRNNINPYIKARKAAGWSSVDMAKAAGFSFSSVWCLEKGMVSAPNPRFAEVLAKVGVDVDGIEDRYTEWRRASGEEMIKRCITKKGVDKTIERIDAMGGAGK